MIVIALGGNLPHGPMRPEQTLDAALAALQEQGDVKVIARSRFWSSPAWPDPSSPPYVNAAALLETALSPEALLARLHEVEARFGRVRSDAERWASRTLDLDLIDYDGAVRDGPGHSHIAVDRWPAGG
jgi:2-amino-4-hydroxy-6-hydroxymethyldihydropteridine diphosphokinase